MIFFHFLILFKLTSINLLHLAWSTLVQKLAKCSFKGVLHLLPKLSIFVLCLKTFWKINYASYKKLLQGTQTWHWNFSRPSYFLSYRSKQSKCCFWINTSRTCLAYLDFDAIFEFLGQFSVRYIYYISKRCW